MAIEKKKEGNEAIIKLNDVSKSYGNHLVLDNISFEIKKDEIMGIIGASGSGKTTLLNIMIGFLNPNSGEVLFRYARSNSCNCYVFCSFGLYCIYFVRRMSS